MSIMARLVLVVFNLLGIACAGSVMALAAGWSYPITYLQTVSATADSRFVLGAVGLVMALIFLLGLIWSMTTDPKLETVEVIKSETGDVSMSVAAAKVIIMKAVRQVEGVKEIIPSVYHSPRGLTVKLHAMINPDSSVPDVSKCLQDAVRDGLEKYGGLQVPIIKVLVDDFNTGSK